MSQLKQLINDTLAEIKKETATKINSFSKADIEFANWVEDSKYWNADEWVERPKLADNHTRGKWMDFSKYSPNYFARNKANIDYIIYEFCAEPMIYRVVVGKGEEAHSVKVAGRYSDITKTIMGWRRDPKILSENFAKAYEINSGEIDNILDKDEKEIEEQNKKLYNEKLEFTKQSELFGMIDTEQKNAIYSIDKDKSYWVSGVAGTGKTVVANEAIAKIVSNSNHKKQNAISFYPNDKIIKYSKDFFTEMKLEKEIETTSYVEVSNKILKAAKLQLLRDLRMELSNYYFTFEKVEEYRTVRNLFEIENNEGIFNFKNEGVKLKFEHVITANEILESTGINEAYWIDYSPSYTADWQQSFEKLIDGREANFDEHIMNFSELRAWKDFAMSQQLFTLVGEEETDSKIKNTDGTSLEIKLRLMKSISSARSTKEHDDYIALLQRCVEVLSSALNDAKINAILRTLREMCALNKINEENCPKAIYRNILEESKMIFGELLDVNALLLDEAPLLLKMPFASEFLGIIRSKNIPYVLSFDENQFDDRETKVIGKALKVDEEINLKVVYRTTKEIMDIALTLMKIQREFKAAVSEKDSVNYLTYEKQQSSIENFKISDVIKDVANFIGNTFKTATIEIDVKPTKDNWRFFYIAFSRVERLLTIIDPNEYLINI